MIRGNSDVMDPRPHRLAIYDMDKTITRRATYTSFLIHAARARAPWRLSLLPLAGLAGVAFKCGLIGRGGVKEAAQRLILGPVLGAAEAERMARDFAASLIPDGLFPGALRQIAADRAAGYRLVMATASYEFYVTAIAQALGFDAVIATRSLRSADGAILPRIDGENCYGAAKRRMVERWMADQGIARDEAEIRFYSDHVTDAPMLALADQGFAVNAHPPLAKLAAEQGWPLLDWRT